MASSSLSASSDSSGASRSLLRCAACHTRPWKSYPADSLLPARSFGAVAPILLIHLRALAIPERAVGFFLTATLLGDVVLSLFVTQTADMLGRRRMLALGSALMCASGIAFFLSSTFVVLLVAAIVGVISTTGNETGPFAALEEAMLSQLTEQDGRVSVRLPLPLPLPLNRSTPTC